MQLINAKGEQGAFALSIKCLTFSEVILDKW